MEHVIVERHQGSGRISSVRVSENCQCDSGWENISCRHIGDDGCNSVDELVSLWERREEEDRINP